MWIVCGFKNYELYLFFLKLKKCVGVKAMYDSVGSWCLKKVQKSNILCFKSVVVCACQSPSVCMARTCV